MLRTLILSILCFPLFAQSAMTGIDPEGATKLHVSANFSQVDLRQGDGDQITVEHSVIVEGKPRPDLADLEVERDGQTIRVNELRPLQEDFVGIWKKGNRHEDCCNSQISMIVRVPAGMEVTVETVYGGVEVTDLPGLREIDATYGGVTVVVPEGALGEDLKLYSNYGSVDLSLPPGTGADLELQTEHGELLTDLDISIDEDESERRDLYERVVGTVGGGGAQVQCESPYGKVYLRLAR